MKLPICYSENSVLLVPYRNREAHLQLFISELKNYFSKKQIYIIEQADTLPFNRGMLFNVGFKETKHLSDCFIFHDVDLIPIRGKVDYSYCALPTHLSAHCSQFDYVLPYENIFGGVVMLTSAHFEVVNGFPNAYKGWGGEDDALFNSLLTKGIKVARKDCWFTSLDHERHVNPLDHRRNVELYLRGRDFNDGLTSCNYTVLSRLENDFFTHIKVLPEHPWK